MILSRLFYRLDFLRIVLRLKILSQEVYYETVNVDPETATVYLVRLLLAGPLFTDPVELN